MFQKEGRLAGSWNTGCQIFVSVYFCVFVCLYFYCSVQQSQVRGVNGCLEHWQDQFPPPAQGFQQLPHLFVFLVFLIIIIIILIINWLILKLTIPNISSSIVPLSPSPVFIKMNTCLSTSQPKAPNKSQIFCLPCHPRHYLSNPLTHHQKDLLICNFGPLPPPQWKWTHDINLMTDISYGLSSSS